MKRWIAFVLSFLLLPVSLSAGEMTRQEENAILEKANLLSTAFTIVARRVRPAVVSIRTERTARFPANRGDPFSMLDQMLRNRFPKLQERRVPAGQGSGVIVDKAGFVLTNHHVVENADLILVKLDDGREVQAKFVGSDPDSDIAVLQVESPNLITAPMGDSDDCRVGQWVLAMGAPFGFERSISSGIISARGRSGVGIVEHEDFIQTDAAINPGNSGGPLVDLKGQVIGINTAIFSKSGGYQGIGFSIPINIARTIMRGIIANKRVTSSYLGVQLQSLTAELANAFGLQSARGALVLEVLAGTPAAKAGIKRGDVIVRYGKRIIEDDQHMRNLVATTMPGEEVELAMVRAGKTHTVKVKVESIPDQVQLARESRKLLEDLGIELVALNETLRRRLGYDAKAWGIVVSAVGRGSTAAQIGLRPGSLILRVNGVETKTLEALRKALTTAEEQGGLDLTWRVGRYYRRVFLRFQR